MQTDILEMVKGLVKGLASQFAHQKSLYRSSQVGLYDDDDVRHVVKGSFRKDVF